MGTDSSRSVKGVGLSMSGNFSSENSGKDGSRCKKRFEKGTDEYRRYRERNNIAVRKYREKKKKESLETEEKLRMLIEEYQRLRKRVEQLTGNL